MATATLQSAKLQMRLIDGTLSSGKNKIRSITLKGVMASADKVDNLAGVAGAIVGLTGKSGLENLRVDTYAITE